MQAMLAAFLQINTKNSAIQSVQADQIGRTYPPLFMINLPKEEEIIDDLREITTMEYVVQVIMIIVCIAIVIIIMYFCYTKCRHTHTIFKYCFPFLPISGIVRTSKRTDLFVEVTNITKDNGIWAHFVSTGCFPTQIQLSRLIQKDDVQIETVCCIFKWIRINWSSINVTEISRIMINMPDTAYVSIFMDNDLTHIMEDQFEIKLIARILDQMYVVHTHTIFKYCFPFLPISGIVRMSKCTDLFVEVTNITKDNGIWTHFISTGCFPTQIQLSRPIQKDDVQIETICCIFKWIRINWSSINVTGISRIMINMPDTAYVSIFMDNDLTHITKDQFEIKLIARILDQMYVVHTHTIFKYCFPFLPISGIVRMSKRTDLFVEVTNITKDNGIWAHFVSTGCFPTQIQLSRPIQKDDVQIETICCIFKWIRIKWSSINVTGISRIMINMPDTAYVSIFMDNDLTHITEDQFEIKLIARILD